MLFVLRSAVARAVKLYSFNAGRVEELLQSDCIKRKAFLYFFFLLQVTGRIKAFCIC